MMSDQSSTSEWIQFFEDAGLPANVAANYAIIFHDNRINMEMLMDLSKEYLYDMGIRIMGDVIAILKHAKEYHTELAKAKMMGYSTQSSMMLRNSSPANRMLGRLTRPVPSSSGSDSSPSHLLLSSSPQTAAIKRSYSNVMTPTVISLKKKKYVPVEVNEPVVKRIRRIQPNDQGTDKIKIPSGIPEHGRKMLEKKQQLQIGTKKSVFDRLGEDTDVSSSTDIRKSKPVSSVFSRLGSSGEVSTSSLALNTGKALSISSQPLQYQGVLKRNPVRTTAPGLKITTVKNPSSRLAVSSTVSKRFVFNNSQELRSSGVKQINTILARNAAPPSSSLGQRSTIKLRSEGVLGAGKVVNTRKSILSRLGDKNRIQITSTSQTSRPVGSRIGFKAQRQSVFQRLGN